jgi:hypothetical protein
MDILERLPHSDPRVKAQAKVLHKCRKDSCPGVALEDAEGYCARCAVSKYKNREINLPKHPTEEGIQAEDPQEIAWSVGKVMQASSHREDKKQTCATQGCEGIQCTDTSNLCVSCLKKFKKNRLPFYIMESQTVPEKESKKDPTCATLAASRPSQEARAQTGTISPIDMEVSSPGSPFLTSYEQQLNGLSLCAKPGCKNPGHDMQSGYCVECYKAICTKTASLGAASDKKIYTGTKEILALTPRCRREGCPMYGSEEYRGFCSKCGIQELDKGTFTTKPVKNKQIPSEWKQAKAGLPEKVATEPVKMVEPPDKSLTSSKEDLKSADLCRNEQCFLYGDPCFNGYCSECHRKLHLGVCFEPVEVSYSGGVSEYNSPTVIHTTQIPIKTQERTRSEVHQQATIVVNTNMQPSSNQTRSTFVIGNQSVRNISGRTTTVLPTSHLPIIQTQPPSISTNYREAAARIENQSRMSVSKCKMPSCTNYGHSSRQGYCNSCFVKVEQERFEKFDARTNPETS